MKKISLFIILILALLVAACSGGASSPTTLLTEVPSTIEVNTQGGEATLESTTVETGDLTGTTWAWIGFTDPNQQLAVENPLDYTLDFQDDGTVNIKADCNNAIGSYTVDEQSLTIEIGPMTMAACPPESRSDDFVKYLSSTAIHFFEKGNLYIDLMADGGTMNFVPAETLNADESEGAVVDLLWSNPWQWIAFTSPVEQIQIDNPENYTLTFQQDGTLNVKADCNNAMGSYSVDGNSLTIDIGPMTKAACPPESLSDDFVKYLGSAAIYFYENGSLFIDLFADGGTMKFNPLSGGAGNDQLSALGIDVNAEPFSGELFLGGGEEHWLNPTLISTIGGTSESTGIDADSLGDTCLFTVPDRPDVVVNWEAEEGVDALKFFFLSMGDPSLMLVTPSGKVLCSDDLNPLVLDPYIEVQNPEPGRYAAFLGSYEGDAVYPGFLVVTSLDYNPATMDLAQLFPRQVDPRGLPQVLSLDVLKTDSSDAKQPSDGKLSLSDLPFSQDFTAGGEIGAFNLQQENPLCTGFISAIPTFRFEWTGEAQELVMFFESTVDTTLVVLGPDQKFTCDDDFQGSENVNPGLTLTPENGMYYVWVGSFSPDVQAEGTLTITNDTNSQPVALASKDLNQ
jgi:heat shock protein HslJ